MRPQFLCLVLLLSSVLVSSCVGDDSSVDNVQIVGEWQVVAVHNSSPSGPTFGPGDEEVITINFLGNGEYSGTTSANSFWGTYSASAEVLALESMASTEVADTTYGQAFFASIVEAMDTNTGIAVFGLNFQDGNGLLLEYQSFKFLGLQRP